MGQIDRRRPIQHLLDVDEHSGTVGLHHEVARMGIGTNQLIGIS